MSASKAESKLNQALGRAIKDFNMITDGDRIVVALSGGKDSMALLILLTRLLNRAPVSFELFPIHIDPGFENSFAGELASYCRRSGYPFKLVKTDFGVVAHSETNRENPCFLCARLRRKRLFEMADALGCNKLALGHNKDDIIETLFLNMCYAGEIGTMLPAQPMFGGAFEVIRPLGYSDQGVIREFAQQVSLPIYENPCPSAKTSRRQHIKSMLEKLYASNSKIKGNIFRALHHVKLDYLLSPSDRPDSDTAH